MRPPPGGARRAPGRPPRCQESQKKGLPKRRPASAKPMPGRNAYGPQAARPCSKPPLDLHCVIRPRTSRVERHALRLEPLSSRAPERAQARHALHTANPEVRQVGPAKTLLFFFFWNSLRPALRSSSNSYAPGLPHRAAVSTAHVSRQSPPPTPATFKDTVSRGTDRGFFEGSPQGRSEQLPTRPDPCPRAFLTRYPAGTWARSRRSSEKEGAPGGSFRIRPGRLRPRRRPITRSRRARRAWGRSPETATAPGAAFRPGRGR